MVKIHHKTLLVLTCGIKKKIGLMFEKRFYFQFHDMKKIAKIFNKINNLIEFTL